MKHTKKFLITITALALSLILTGCTDGKHGDSDEDVTKGANAPESQTTSAYLDSAEDAH